MSFCQLEKYQLIYTKYHHGSKWSLSLSYFLIFQRGPGRLWGGLTTQTPLLWLKHATTVLSFDKYKRSRKLSASFLAFSLEDFNTLTEICKLPKQWRVAVLKQKTKNKKQNTCHSCCLMSVAFGVKFQLLFGSPLVIWPSSMYLGSPLATYLWSPYCLALLDYLPFSKCIMLCQPTVLPSNSLLFLECFSFIS